jgi:hypothetical protein
VPIVRLREANAKSRGTHKAGIADHVGCKDGREPAFQALSPSPGRLTTKDRRIHAVRMAGECPLLALSRHSERCGRESALSPKADSNSHGTAWPGLTLSRYAQR